MSRAISIYHGRFGRATLYQLNRPKTTHAHREGHLTFHVEGQEAMMHVSKQQNEIGFERAAAINPWQPHDFIPGDLFTGSLFLVLYIKPIWFLDAGRTAHRAFQFGRTPIDVTAQIRCSLQKVVTLLLECNDTDLFDGYLYELTRECFDQSWQWTPDSDETSRGATTISDYRIRKSIQLMTERLGSEMEFDSVAKESGLSRPHFYKLFRRQTGITPNLYFNTLRMEKAIELLTESERSVTDIGFDLGFSCQSGFTRFFSSNVGLAPSDYRRVTHKLNA